MQDTQESNQDEGPKRQREVCRRQTSRKRNKQSFVVVKSHAVISSLTRGTFHNRRRSRVRNHKIKKQIVGALCHTISPRRRRSSCRGHSQSNENHFSHSNACSYKAFTGEDGRHRSSRYRSNSRLRGLFIISLSTTTMIRMITWFLWLGILSWPTIGNAESISLV